ncbi:MAG: polysaccharide deacetylase family protein [Rhodospirillaceae bacterium]|nr:polysaccharide deacetylase family protein [Rhodospirillaceae bacterium]
MNNKLTRHAQRGLQTLAFITAFLLGTSNTVLAGTPSADATAAVALMYHRFGEDGIPATNIRIEQFERHLQILADGGYHVAPLPEIVAALKAGTPIPPKTIVITVDDAYASVLSVAWPRLKARGWPLTVFVATDPVDHNTPGYLTWEQIRNLAAEGVTIGAHSKSHAHMAKLSASEAAQEIATANARFQAELGTVPTLFAYPYGEANAGTQNLAAQTFEAAFGQHSGVMTAADNRFFLPRFALNETYGNEDRFRLLINTLPIPATDVTPADPTLTRNPPLFGFTVADDAISLRGIQCYASSEGETTTEVLGRRVEVRQAHGFKGTRGRINCTLMGPNGRWRWYGRMFYLPKEIRRDNAHDD